MEPVLIVSTGVANTASVSAAIRRCGYEVELSDDADRVRAAQRVVLPGVGSFGAGMERLRERGLDRAIRDRAERERPLLAICLGLQLLCRRSEESIGVDGLNVIESDVCRLPISERVPQFGWNRVCAAEDSLIDHGYAYYANSFCLLDCAPDWTVSTSFYGREFVAAVERGPILACQFHPELSGQWGADLIERWLVRAEAITSC